VMTGIPGGALSHLYASGRIYVRIALTSERQIAIRVRLKGMHVDVEHRSNMRDLITTLFEKWEAGDMTPFFSALSDDVRWTAIGTTPISGAFSSKEGRLIEAVLRQFARRLARRINLSSTISPRWHKPSEHII